MPIETTAAATPPAPAAAQSVTVMPPAASPFALDVGHLGTWAGSIVAIAAVLTLLYKLFIREISRDVAAIRHKAANTATRMDALEHVRAGDIERIVRVETSIAGVEKGVDRVERTVNDRFDTLLDLMREMRAAPPRG